MVPVGSLSPNAIHLPGIYVDRITRATSPKSMEFTTLAPSPTSSPSPASTLTPEKAKAQAQRHHIAKHAAKELEGGFHVSLARDRDADIGT